MNGPVERAREALRSGATPVEAYTELAAGTRDLRGAALAVCEALGIPRADAGTRLGDGDGRWGGFGPGEESLLGELLETIGVFDTPVALDEPGERIRALMRRAPGALGGIASGAALGVHRKLYAGRLPEAYATLVRLPVRECGDPVRYWATLGTVGELLAAWLPPGDPEAAGRVREAREHCARQAAATAR
ncbi:hypothetical protein [Streptomyces sp. NPDC057939]|uniref:hypothetical protein n=1 Tax=Streptomyces sp. NPDC057939 TaxID=3346284 RepID=UPI0036E81306